MTKRHKGEIRILWQSEYPWISHYCLKGGSNAQGTETWASGWEALFPVVPPLHVLSHRQSRHGGNCVSTFGYSSAKTLHWGMVEEGRQFQESRMGAGRGQFWREQDNRIQVLRLNVGLEEKLCDLTAQMSIDGMGKTAHRYGERVNWWRNRTTIRGRSGILL